jgi:outer membrane protein TolC
MLACLVVVGVMVTHWAATYAGSESEPVAPTRLQTLQRERVETLQYMVDLLTNQWYRLDTPLVEVLDARIELTDALLELTRAKEERVKLLQQQVGFARRVEKMAETRFRRGWSNGNMDQVRAKAARLELEIRLVKEQHSASPG